MVVTSGMRREENVFSFDVKLILLKGARQAASATASQPQLKRQPRGERGRSLFQHLAARWTAVACCVGSTVIAQAPRGNDGDPG